MKILFEATPAYAQRTGIGHYVHRLFGAAIAFDKKNKYWAYCFTFLGRNKKRLFGDKVGYRYITIVPGKLFNLLARNIGSFPVDILTRFRPDIIVYTNYVYARSATKAKIITFIYDVSHELYSDYSNAKNTALLRRTIPSAVKNSTAIATISESSKNSIIEMYGAAKEQVYIISPAVDHSLYYPRSQNEIDVLRRKYGLGKPYILCVATIEPRKNLVGLLKAFDALPESIKKSHSLVLTGAKGWLDDEISELYEKLSAKYDVIKTGYLPDDDLPVLYSGAKLFAYPTFYEGFGMPPLEAMACGVPVVTTNNSSLPEVVGDAAILVSADHIQEISDAMNRVLSDPKLAASLSKKGLARAQLFTWGRSAKQLIAMLDRVGSNK